MLRLSRAQLREVDRISIEEYGLPGIVLMENAARSTSMIVRERMPELLGRRVTVLCGTGNNGGDGYALARYLVDFGCRVELVEATVNDSPDARIFRTVARHFGVETTIIHAVESVVPRTDFFIDAIFGTGLNRPPTIRWREAITAMNESGLPIVALDVPSGLDCDTGEPISSACVRATHTITFVAEKLGFANPKSRAYTGEIIVGDIGCPREIIDRVARMS